MAVAPIRRSGACPQTPTVLTLVVGYTLFVGGISARTCSSTSPPLIPAAPTRLRRTRRSSSTSLKAQGAAGEERPRLLI